MIEAGQQKNKEHHHLSCDDETGCCSEPCGPVYLNESRAATLARKIIRPLGGSAIFHFKEGISARSHFMPPEFEPETELTPES